MMARLGFQIVLALLQFRPGRLRQQPFLLQQPGQRGRTETEGARAQKMAAGAETFWKSERRVHINPGRGIGWRRAAPGKGSPAPAKTDRGPAPRPWLCRPSL